MMLLPKDVGPFTLVRKLGTGTVAESYLGRMNTDGGRRVVVRRVLPYILQDPGRRASTEARVRDLMGVRHPFLVRVLNWVEDGDERFIVEEFAEGIDLERVLGWCRTHDATLPHNVFLNIATQICNGLEALHGRPGRGSGADNVLHLGLKPGAIMVNAEGKVILGGFGLTRSPTALSHAGVAGPVPSRMEYLSPEQTQPDQKLTPASDIFALGAVLYELLTLEPLFRSDSNLQTINRIRRAEVTSELLRVKEIMPGLDKVLYRALSVNPRHRYQRAFVLREDLRGLMAGYSFASIVEDTRAFFAPMLEDAASAAATPAATPAAASAPSTVAAPPPVPTAPLAMAGAGDEPAAATPGLQVREVQPQSPPGAGSPSGDEDRALEHGEVEDGALEHGEVEDGALEHGAVEDSADEDSADEDSAGDSGAASVSVGLGVAPPSPGGPPVVPGAPPPAVPSPAPAVDEFDDDIATRIDRRPETTAAYAAEALRGQQGSPVMVEEEATASAPAVSSSDEPVDEISPSVDGGDEELADRSTLPIPTGAEGFDDVTDVSAQQGEANDTRAFLRGQGRAAAPPPPPALPDPAASGFDSGERPSPRVPAPVVPTSEAVGGVAAAPPTVPTPDAAAPRTSGLSARLAAAPPPVPSTPRSDRGDVPPPAVSAAATPAAPDDDDDELLPHRSGNGMVIGVAAMVAVLILVCGVGAWFLNRDITDQAATDALAVLDQEGTEASSGDAPGQGSADEANPADATAPPAGAAGGALGDTEGATAADATTADATAADATAADATAADATAADATAADATAADATAADVAPRSAPTTAARQAPSTSRAAAEPARPASSPVGRADDGGRSTASAARGVGGAHGRRTSGSAPAASAASSNAAALLADLDSASDEPLDEDTPVTDADIERYAGPASSGRLSSSDIMALEMVGIDDPAYTRSRALLLMHAQRNGDDEAAGRYLDQLMLLPENQYNPIYLSDLARYLVNHERYSEALEKANLAERYWARLPSDLVFSKKAEIYETQAAAWQGRFYQSDDDLELLEQAIRHWKKYRDHVATRSRSDLARRADAELAKLEDIRTRLH